MKKIKIIAVSGIRSDYELLYPVLNELQKRSNVSLGVIATGAHNSFGFGDTIKDIKKDGFKIIGAIENLLNSNSVVGKAKSAGILLTSLPELLARERPDLVVALGDREEPLIAAIAANCLNIPFAHIAGGDRSYPVIGDLDEGFRHATTKLSHIHFAMMPEHAERICKLGEESWRVFTVGNPGLDRIRLEKKLSKSELSKQLGVDISVNKNIVLIQHVIHQEASESKRQIQMTLDALSSFDANLFIIHPNSDAGSLQMIEEIELQVAKHNNFRCFKNLPRKIFINLLRNADLLIGNSSAGIIEAPYLKLPTINVGQRQKDRAHTYNVVFVPFNKEEIILAIDHALHDKAYIKKVKNCKSIYGDGFSAQRIAEILSEKIQYDERLLAKDITY
jgi:GDP/UDP-N,N'-diacetylbacillosamine 2-epimerase (hydrolysing)